MHNAGYIITQVFSIADELNLHFSLVFTRDDTSALPVTVTKFNGTEGERLGQLVVTPEVVVSNIISMNNTSPGVYGIAQKTQQETVTRTSV